MDLPHHNESTFTGHAVYSKQNIELLTADNFDACRKKLAPQT